MTVAAEALDRLAIDTIRTLAIDGVQLKQFDYVDISAVIDLSNVVIVIIKSLLFR